MAREFFFFFQAEDGIRDVAVTGVQTCALPISTVVASVDHRSAEGEPGPGADQQALQRRRVLHPGFELQLVVRPAHSRIASSTAAVSRKSANTCAAPAARSAATS